MAKQTYMGIAPDYVDECGNWRKSITSDYMQWHTLSGRRWSGINARCRANSSFQKREPTYVGCENKFKSFNNFVVWSRDQVGYESTDYQLDKDLLFRGNKIYSEAFCIFLPKRVNTLLVKCDSSRGDLPIGVYWSNSNKSYVAQCQDGSGTRVYVGKYSSPDKAFIAYKEYKERLIKQVAEEFKNAIDERAYNALLNYTVEISD